MYWKFESKFEAHVLQLWYSEYELCAWWHILCLPFTFLANGCCLRIIHKIGHGLFDMQRHFGKGLSVTHTHTLRMPSLLLGSVSLSHYTKKVIPKLYKLLFSSLIFCLSKETKYTPAISHLIFKIKTHVTIEVTYCSKTL